MSLGVDPIVSNLFFSLNLVPHLSSFQGEYESQYALDQYPLISVIFAVYRESSEDVLTTVKSLLGQTYPGDRLQILIVVEVDDISTRDIVRTVAMPALTKAGLDATVILTDGTRHTKPYALNRALQEANGEYCVFYDAADTFEAEQIEKGIGIMVRGGFDVAQAKVVRKGASILSKFLLLDTLVWYWKYVPLILRCSKGFPLSGEGLFIRREVLHEMGCFPDVLTEDALLGIMLTERGKRFALLDTVVFEKAPRNLRAHVRQKMRWHRGYLTCLLRLRSANIRWPGKLFFLMSFATPIASSLGTLGWIAILYGFLANALGAGQARPETISNVLHYWSIFLICIGIPLTISTTVVLTVRLQLRHYAPVAFGLPFYWIFVGCCATASLFRGTRDWGKTDR
jgi:cellulose synthase/poly-beta-1,6-N-acetylglucosamine synthase-like glycosyltransferase